MDIKKRFMIGHFTPTLTDEKIQEIYRLQKESSPEWTLFHEREFIENLLATRFNFFIAVFSLFLVAVSTIQSVTNTIIVLSIAVLFLFCLWVTIFRIYTKLMVTLTLIYRLGKQQWFCIIRDEVDALKPVISGNVNVFIGLFIPLGCILLFLTGIICVAFGWIEPLGQ